MLQKVTDAAKVEYMATTKLYAWVRTQLGSVAN